MPRLALFRESRVIRAPPPPFSCPFLRTTQSGFWFLPASAEMLRKSTRWVSDKFVLLSASAVLSIGLQFLIYEIVGSCRRRGISLSKVWTCCPRSSSYSRNASHPEIVVARRFETSVAEVPESYSERTPASRDASCVDSNCRRSYSARCWAEIGALMGHSKKVNISSHTK